MADHVLNAAGTHVWMVHEETGGVWECPLGYAPVAEVRGWTYCPAPDLSLAGLFDPTQPAVPQTGFDPAEHTADEVLSHLQEHAVDAPGEVARVLGLEEAGKARKTVLAFGRDDTDPGD